MLYENCEWCVYRDKRNLDICNNCSHNTDITKPNFELGAVDILKVAEGLKKKREQNDRKSEPKPENTAKQPVKLEACPQCGKISLFYNEANNKHECLNLECKSRKGNLFINVVWPNSPTQIKEAQSESTADHQEELSNPLLLGVKMFLADIRSWRRQYREDEYVCADFAQEVYDAATERSIRCGYVIISFVNSDVGHAIVAFETDYGLKFFEPQDGNEEDVIIGHRYSGQIKGTPEDNVIREIEITWNDGKTTRID
ncbi:MAG: hypothetical protein PHU23_09145 [Dehalococcoidales bacterium]|nr:hypothetical protein [Dehalococcoidales bacterium]